MDEPALLILLEALVRETQACTLARLHAATAIPPTTLNRLLHTLTDCGYAVRPGHGVYQPGPRLLALASSTLEHAYHHRCIPLLKELAKEMGLNAELYAITPQGPVMLHWEGGHSEFQVRMYPGFHLAATGHPALAIFQAAFPAAVDAWGKPFQHTTLTPAEWTTAVARAHAGEVVQEQGKVRPELARACLATSDRRYCVGLSGLISEFQTPPDQLAERLRQTVSKIEAILKGE